MRRLFWLMLGAVMGGGLVWGAMNYHVVRTNSGLVVAHKQEAKLADTYFDTRSWGIVEWSEHPALVAALHQSGHSDVVENKGVVETTFRGAVDAISK